MPDEAQAGPPRLRVQLVRIGADGPVSARYELPGPATVGDVLRLAGIDPPVVGVFGRVASRQDPLHDGDRVEVYRGPAVDARAVRRARAGRKVR